MEKGIQTVSVTVYNKDEAFEKVSTILHEFAPKILLRVGYPMKERNIAIIFLITELTNDEVGSLTGKLGQIRTVKVKSNTLKI